MSRLFGTYQPRLSLEAELTAELRLKGRHQTIERLIVVMPARKSQILAGAAELQATSALSANAEVIEAPAAFVTEWRTTTSPQSITLPIVNGGTYDFHVDWGDGTDDHITAFGDAARIHEYATWGTYEVRITGTIQGWNFGVVTTSRDLIHDVAQWGPFKFLDNATSSFRACSNLVCTALDAPDTSNVTTMRQLFNLATSFTGDLSGWDLSGVTSTVEMFEQSAFNGDISTWNVGNVTTMHRMFENCPFNGDISGWDVSNVADFSRMFRLNSVFNGDISTWNTVAALNMSYMFQFATNFNQPIGTWNVGNVTTMLRMFESSLFNQDISGWNTSTVTDMERVFVNAVNFDQNIGAWDVSNVTTMAAMLFGVTLSTPNYDALLNGWAARPSLQTGVPFHAGTSKYSSAGAAARAVLVDTWGWIITDGGPA